MKICAMALAVGTAVLCTIGSPPTQADSGVVEPTTPNRLDILGWRGLNWGTPISRAKTILGNRPLDHQEAIEFNGCYFTRALPLELNDEAWQAWLCEDRQSGAVIGVSLEKGFEGMFFGALRKTDLFDTFLAEFTAQYGPAHLFWEQCHNARWNATVQYKWFFPTTTVRLVMRDVPDRWVSVRFEQPSDLPDFGPGVCVKRPVDLRG
jgi:hypothetical protein